MLAVVAVMVAIAASAVMVWYMHHALQVVREIKLTLSALISAIEGLGVPVAANAMTERVALSKEDQVVSSVVADPEWRFQSDDEAATLEGRSRAPRQPWEV